jgi:hypothetical protein
MILMTVPKTAILTCSKNTQSSGQFLKHEILRNVPSSETDKLQDSSREEQWGWCQDWQPGTMRNASESWDTQP